MSDLGESELWQFFFVISFCLADNKHALIAKV